MMHRDYYALQRMKLRGSSLNVLEQEAATLEAAKLRKDSAAIKQAERQIRNAAGEAVRVEPHVAYLWFEAHASELGNAIRDAWRVHLKASAIPQAFHLAPDFSTITCMPALSFSLHIPFRLEKSYISRDDRDFHLLDNPLRKEKIFQTPMVASTSWKGALRAALWQLGLREDHEVTVRLFGNSRNSEEYRSGRLHFFPTFFDQIGVEVINPHDRKTGAGARGPIPIECVPRNAEGVLFLLYVPFGSVGQNEKDSRAEVAQDLEAVAEGVHAMMTVYGFGAKTSSGFGTAADHLARRGTLALRATLADNTTSVAVPSKPQQPDLPRYLESSTRLQADLCRPDGSLKSEADYQTLIEGRGQKYAKKDKQLYAKAKNWWEREGHELIRSASEEAEPESVPTLPKTPPVSEWTFSTLPELHEVAQRVARLLKRGNEL